MEKWEFIQNNRICEKKSILIKLIGIHDHSIQQEKASLKLYLLCIITKSNLNKIVFNINPFIGCPL